jgi:hypothetical protein
VQPGGLLPRRYRGFGFQGSQLSLGHLFWVIRGCRKNRNSGWVRLISNNCLIFDAHY